jgi:hypothetical protein
MIFEPKWKSLLANTTAPIFTPEQCQDIINMGHQQKAEEAKVGHKDKKKESMILKKESPPSAGFLLKQCLRCIKLLNEPCFKSMVIILVMKA